MHANDNVPLADETLRLIAGAQQESARLQHEYIGIEHFMLALTRHGADSPLTELGLDVARVQQLLEEAVGRGLVPVRADLNRPFTSRTKKVFGYGEEAARALGQSRVAIGHILYGMMREGKGIGAQVFHHEGVTAELVENMIRRSSEQS